MKKVFLTLGLVAIAFFFLIAATVPFSAFNTNQFSTNNNTVTVKSGALVSNLFLYDNAGNQFWFTNNTLAGNGGSPQIGNALNAWSGFFSSVFLNNTNITNFFGNGTDTNAIANKNGFGTNTTFKGRVLFTNETSVQVNTNIYTGTGTVSVSVGTHNWTIVGGTISDELYGSFIIVNTIDQYKISGITDSTHFTTVRAANSGYSGVIWQYYTNYWVFYDGNTSPNVVATIDGGGGYNVKGQEFANDGGFLLGSGSRYFYFETDPNYGGYGPMNTWRSSVGIPIYLGLLAPNNSFGMYNDGYLQVGVGISNNFDTPIKIAGTATVSSTNGVIEVRDTWNTSGSPVAMAVHVTDTARGANSRLVGLYGGAGGNTRLFDVDRVGNLFLLGGVNSQGAVNAVTGFVTTTGGITAQAGGGVIIGGLVSDTMTLNGNNPGPTNVPTWGDVTNMIAANTQPAANFILKTNGTALGVLTSTNQSVGLLSFDQGTAMTIVGTNSNIGTGGTVVFVGKTPSAYSARVKVDFGTAPTIAGNQGMWTNSIPVQADTNYSVLILPCSINAAQQANLVGAGLVVILQTTTNFTVACVGTPTTGKTDCQYNILVYR